MGRIPEGLRYLEISYEINSDYPNTLYGLAVLADKQQEFSKAFTWGTECMKKTKFSDQLHQLAYVLTKNACDQLLASVPDKAIRERFLQALEGKADIPVYIEKDESITVAAKLEIAETYKRSHHLVKYKEEQSTVTHLIMHELSHLRMILDARSVGKNCNHFFVTNSGHKHRFLSDFSNTVDRLRKNDQGEDAITSFMQYLFSGINLQIYNAPLDLFIEHSLYNSFPELRPMQFLSLDKLIGQGIAAVSSKDSGFVPRDILSASKILNMVAALQFRDLYGADLSNHFRAELSQSKIALSFYNEFQESLANFAPGKEYALILHWAAPLKLKNYFDLIPEDEYKSLSDVETILNKLEEREDEEETARPLDAIEGSLNYENEPAGQMAVTMHCLDALQTFRKMTQEQIKSVGFEIAMLGDSGINPGDTAKRHHLASIKDKTFSSLQLLAFMYVAWQQIDPSKDIGLSFGKEYALAKQMLTKE